ncbi:MAG: hypothetical protein AAGN35_01515 [Bacteroidota bacterium]
MPRTDSILSRFPGFYRSGDRLNHLYRFIEVFGKQVDVAEEDLVRVMRSRWVNTANNAGSEGFDTSEKGDLDKVFALYLEALGGTSLLRQKGRRPDPEGLADDKGYRERILGLIRVLRDGASTKEGIIAIVAANLGIVGETEMAVKARQSIRVEEFLPESYPVQQFDRALYEEALVLNPNYVDLVPQVRIVIKPGLPTPLVKPTLVNLQTGEFARFEGTVQQGEELSFLTDGTALLEGLPVPITGSTPRLLPGYNKLIVGAAYGMPAGRFDQDRWDFARFDQPQLASPGQFDQAFFDQAVFTDGSPVVDIEVALMRFTPGTFMVRIPWDIEGYTENLDNSPDKPREKIRFIVDRVKAAGTFGAITYEKYFQERHEQNVALTLVDHLPVEEQEMAEENFTVSSIAQPYPGGLEHEMQDALSLEGRFDYTTFDSLNTFA